MVQANPVHRTLDLLRQELQEVNWEIELAETVTPDGDSRLLHSLYQDRRRLFRAIDSVSDKAA